MTINKIRVFAGAGLSAESGLATFRDEGGLWTKYDINEVCFYPSFIANKEDLKFRQKIFDFYNEVKLACLQAKPNAAHYELALWQNNLGIETVIFTANVDNLLEQAGCKNVVHVHGDLSSMHCTSCTYSWECDVFSEQRCPKCNSRLTKPNVVFFHENAPLYAKLLTEFHGKRRHPNDLLVYVGSSQSVIPPSKLMDTRRGKEGVKVLVNLANGPEDSLFDYCYYEKASTGLEKVRNLHIK